MAALRRFLLWSALACVGVLASACTSTPAAPDRDAFAKEFLTHPSASAIYVYRSEFNHFDTDTMLYIDGRIVGSTLPGTYFRIDTSPGRHVLHGSGIDVGEFALETRAGQVRFVELNVIGGHSNFRAIPDQVGREHVRACCALLQNWAPRLRPLVLR